MTLRQRLKLLTILLSGSDVASQISKLLKSMANATIVNEWLQEASQWLDELELSFLYGDNYRLVMDAYGATTMRHIIEYGTYQIDLLKTIASHVKVDELLFINVGANVGTSLLNAHAVGFRDFLAFEPVKKNYDYLLRNTEQIKSNSIVDIRHQAVGHTNAFIPIHLNEQASGKHSFKVNFGYKDEQTEMIRLDDLHLIKPNFLFIDTEGFELEVLEGAESLLHYTQGVCAEITPNYITPEELFRTKELLNKNFSQHIINGSLINRPITDNEIYNNSKQFDIISFK